MATRNVTITVKDLRRTMDLAENMVKAVHAALDELRDQDITVPDWVGDEITGGRPPKPAAGVPCRISLKGKHRKPGLSASL